MWESLPPVASVPNEAAIAGVSLASGSLGVFLDDSKSSHCHLSSAYPQQPHQHQQAETGASSIFENPCASTSSCFADIYSSEHLALPTYGVPSAPPHASSTSSMAVAPQPLALSTLAAAATSSALAPTTRAQDDHNSSDQRLTVVPPRQCGVGSGPSHPLSYSFSSHPATSHGHVNPPQVQPQPQQQQQVPSGSDAVIHNEDGLVQGVGGHPLSYGASHFSPLLQPSQKLPHHQSMLSISSLLHQTTRSGSSVGGVSSGALQDFDPLPLQLCFAEKHLPHHMPHSVSNKTLCTLPSSNSFVIVSDMPSASFSTTMHVPSQHTGLCHHRDQQQQQQQQQQQKLPPPAVPLNILRRGLTTPRVGSDMYASSASPFRGEHHHHHHQHTSQAVSGAHSNSSDGDGGGGAGITVALPAAFDSLLPAQSTVASEGLGAAPNYTTTTTTTTAATVTAAAAEADADADEDASMSQRLHTEPYVDNDKASAYSGPQSLHIVSHASLHPQSSGHGGDGGGVGALYNGSGTIATVAAAAVASLPNSLSSVAPSAPTKEEGVSAARQGYIRPAALFISSSSNSPAAPDTPYPTSFQPPPQQQQQQQGQVPLEQSAPSTRRMTLAPFSPFPAHISVSAAATAVPALSPPTPQTTYYSQATPQSEVLSQHAHFALEQQPQPLPFTPGTNVPTAQSGAWASPATASLAAAAVAPAAEPTTTDFSFSRTESLSMTTVAAHSNSHYKESSSSPSTAALQRHDHYHRLGFYDSPAGHESLSRSFFFMDEDTRKAEGGDEGGGGGGGGGTTAGSEQTDVATSVSHTSFFSPTLANSFVLKSGFSFGNSTLRNTHELPPPSLPPISLAELTGVVDAFAIKYEEYQTFKNMCMEAYLGLVETTVDQFLVRKYGDPTHPRNRALLSKWRHDVAAGAGGRAMESITKAGAKLLQQVGHSLFYKKSEGASFSPNQQPTLQNENNDNCCYSTTRVDVRAALSQQQKPRESSYQHPKCYIANAISPQYLDEKPSASDLALVMGNYPIVTHVLKHVLPPKRLEAGGGSHVLHSSMPTGVGAVGDAEPFSSAEYITIHNELLFPIIEAVWREYLSLLETRAEELIRVAEANVMPALEQYSRGRERQQQSLYAKHVDTNSSLSLANAGDALGTNGLRASTAASSRTTGSGGCEMSETLAYQHLLGKYAKTLKHVKGDAEYLTTIKAMDMDFVRTDMGNAEALAEVRDAKTGLSDYVPVYGLVLSRLHRLEVEHRTVLELWGRR